MPTGTRMQSLDSETKNSYISVCERQWILYYNNVELQQKKIMLQIIVHIWTSLASLILVDRLMFLVIKWRLYYLNDKTWANLSTNQGLNAFEIVAIRQSILHPSRLFRARLNRSHLFRSRLVGYRVVFTPIALFSVTLIPEVFGQSRLHPSRFGNHTSAIELFTSRFSASRSYSSHS